MPECPHCAQQIDKLPGFVSEATMKDRLKSQGEAKDAEIRVLTGEVTDLRGKASTFDAVLTERDKLRGELDGMKQRETRLGALDTHGLDRALLPHVEVLYTSAVAGQDEPQAFDAWLGEQGKAHPLLSHHFGTPAPSATPNPSATPVTPEGNTPPIAPRTAPTETPAQQPPGPGGKMSPEDMRRYFASPEFQAMDAAGKRAKIAEIKTYAASNN